MRPVGLALTAREVQARPLDEVISTVARAEGLGFASVWLLADTVEESIALPLVAAAVGTAVPKMRVGVRLLPYDAAIRMVEDLAVLDNILAGRLDVAMLVGDRAGGGIWGQLTRARSLRDVVNGQPIDLGASGPAAAVRVSPPPKQRLLPVAVWIGGSSLGPVMEALAAGLPVVVDHDLAADLPKGGVGMTASVTEVLGPEADPSTPMAPHASARLTLTSLDDANSTEEIAALMASRPGANADPTWPARVEGAEVTRSHGPITGR
jgi:hypothetical protein